MIKINASIALFLFFYAIGPLSAKAQITPLPQLGPTLEAPPPVLPVEIRPRTLLSGDLTPASEGTTEGFTTLYSIGQPTDEEQLYLEYLNRMRANPTAEGVRLATTTDADVLSAYSYFGVDTNLMQSEFSTNPPVPPLAMNAKLLATARWHSGDMFTNQYQGHYQTNGNGVVMSPWDRMLTNGYNYYTAGENVFSYATSVFDGHAAFAVDWGPGTGGMQTPPGHRDNMLRALFREAGMGVVDGTNGSVGPQLITQDFGTQQSATPLIAGVVYYDFNTNGFYNTGEGIGGVTVNINGSSYYAVTADSGGYAVPVTTNGNYTVSFSANGLTTTQQAVTVSNLANVKVDWAPIYSPPVISGPNPAYLNTSNLYNFTAVGAATGYQWRQIQLSAYTAVEGAENGLTNVTVVSSAGYSVLASDAVASGSYSFHLAQPQPTPQYLMLNPVLQPSTNSQLTFAKRLGYAMPGQIARAQVSTDGGVTWSDVWSQAGSGGSGDSSFSTIAVSLSAYAGQLIQVRFVYDYTSGSYYPQTSTGVGLYLDNIAVTNANQAQNFILSTVSAGTSFVFCPTNTGTYLLDVRAQINSRTLNPSPTATVTVTTPPPGIQIVNQTVLPGNQIQIDFTVTNYNTGMTFQLWKVTDLTGTWVADGSASFQTLIANSKFRVTTSTGAAARGFYRIKGSY